MRSFLIYISVLFVAVDILLADKQITDSISPERSTVLKLEANGKSARSYNWMVVTANPLASEAELHGAADNRRESVALGFW